MSSDSHKNVPDTVNIQEKLSVLEQRWVPHTTNERLVMALSQRFDLPDIVSRVLVGRGIGIETAPRFMVPRLKEELPDPSTLQDMDKSVKRVVQAIISGEPIGIFGDYDVDGATSSALLVRYLRAVGHHEVMTHIPDRQKEGYGLNAPALRAFVQNGAGVCITVDCGTSSFDALEDADECGLDVVVIDHHTPHETLPPAYGIINPNRFDDNSGLGYLAAVGVVFVFLIALNRRLREENFLTKATQPDLLLMLDLVALGTVADVVALHGLNRVFVYQGLKVMAQWQNIGLRALAEVAGINKLQTLEGYHLGFVLGPRINAGSRVSEANLGLRLLSTQDQEEAHALAQTLNSLNTERKSLQEQVEAETDVLIEEQMTPSGDLPAVFLVKSSGWHVGVIGIVASRIKERVNRPVIVGTVHEGFIKASGRSIAGLDLGALIIRAKNQGLLESGGGHAMAIGLTCAVDKWQEFSQYLKEKVAEKVSLMATTRLLYVDGVVGVSGANKALVDTLQKFGPYGSAHPHPKIVINRVSIRYVTVVGGNHVSCRLEDISGQYIHAIAFRALKTALGQALLSSGGRSIDVAGTLNVDYWRGERRVKLYIEDARFS